MWSVSETGCEISQTACGPVNVVFTHGVFLAELVGRTSTDHFRLQRATESLSQLLHPEFVHLYGATAVAQTIAEDDSPAGVHAIIMELCPVTLSDLIHTVGFRPSDVLLASLGLDIANALQQIHELGMVHGEVIPANLFVTENCTAKIIPFGPPANDSSDEGPGPSARHWAPELLRGDVYSPAADVYSFGACMCELALGEEFPTLTGASQISDVLNRIEWKPMANLLQKCFHANPNRRPAMSDVITELCDMVRELSIPAPYDLTTFKVLLCAFLDETSRLHFFPSLYWTHMLAQREADRARASIEDLRNQVNRQQQLIQTLEERIAIATANAARPSQGGSGENGVRPVPGPGIWRVYTPEPEIGETQIAVENQAHGVVVVNPASDTPEASRGTLAPATASPDILLVTPPTATSPDLAGAEVVVSSFNNHDRPIINGNGITLSQSLPSAPRPPPLQNPIHVVANEQRVSPISPPVTRINPDQRTSEGHQGNSPESSLEVASSPLFSVAQSAPTGINSSNGPSVVVSSSLPEPIKPTFVTSAISSTSSSSADAYRRARSHPLQESTTSLQTDPLPPPTRITRVSPTNPQEKDGESGVLSVKSNSFSNSQPRSTSIGRTALSGVPINATTTTTTTTTAPFAHHYPVPNGATGSLFPTPVSPNNGNGVAHKRPTKGKRTSQDKDMATGPFKPMSPSQPIVTTTTPKKQTASSRVKTGDPFQQQHAWTAKTEHLKAVPRTGGGANAVGVGPATGARHRVASAGTGGKTEWRKSRSISASRASTSMSTLGGDPLNEAQGADLLLFGRWLLRPMKTKDIAFSQSESQACCLRNEWRTVISRTRMKSGVWTWTLRLWSNITVGSAFIFRVGVVGANYEDFDQPIDISLGINQHGSFGTSRGGQSLDSWPRDAQTRDIDLTLKVDVEARTLTISRPLYSSQVSTSLPFSDIRLAASLMGPHMNVKIMAVDPSRTAGEECYAAGFGGDVSPLSGVVGS